LGIVQTTYHPQITRLYPTACGQNITPLHDLVVKLSIGGEGDVLLLHGGVHDDFLRLLDLVSFRAIERGEIALLCLLLPSGVESVLNH
jgi:hypothetical protein